MARPIKQPHERRSEQLKIRFTPDELAAIEEEARKASLDRVEFARRLLLGSRVSVAPESVREAKLEAADLLLAIDELTGQTKRVGNNVNQLTRAEYRGSQYRDFWQEIGDQLRAHIGTLETLMSRVSARL